MPILLLFVIFAFVLSCNPAMEESVSVHHNHELSESEPVLVVLHSYDDSGIEGGYFRKVMRDHLKKSHHIEPDIHHIYLDFLHHDDPVESQFGSVQSFVGAIHDLNPSVLLVNDDLVLEYLFEKADTLLKMQPAVFAGCSAPRQFSHTDYPLLTGFVDNISLSENAIFFSKLTGQHNPTVELDWGGYEDRLRQHLYNDISDENRFVNNGDFHMEKLSEDYLSGPEYNDKVVVNFMSMASPGRNHREGQDETVGINNTNSVLFYTSLSYQKQIQVKYDIFSNMLIDADGTPQLTAIREGFGSTDGQRTRFLAGYMTSLSTQITDQLHYALRILEGEDPASIPVGEHDKSYYMDWNAMKLMNPPLQYDDWKDQFKIFNAPFSVSHRKLFHILITASCLLIVIFLSIAVRRISMRNIRELKDTMKRLEQEAESRRLAMGSQGVFVLIRNGSIAFSKGIGNLNRMMKQMHPIEKFRKCVHPDTLAAFDLLANSASSGQNGEQGRIRLRLDTGNGMHWWDLAFFGGTPDADSVAGIAFNIDEQVSREEEIRKSVERAEEMSVKQNFLANITHDIRTPLTAISGFAQLLATSSPDEDRVEYAESIESNTSMLLELMDQAVSMSPDSIDVIAFKLREINIIKVIEDSYRTNRILVPSNLSLKYCPGPEKEVLVKADPMRTTQVLNNLVGNAFKYTPDGSVTISWAIVDDGGKIEVSVTDTGIGISEEDQKTIIGRYVMAQGNTNGTGLGLDICNSIMEKQNGEFGFESKLGEGSRFWFRLALAEKEE